MTNREELEAVIAGAIEDLPMRDCADQGGELDRLRVREAIRAIATALLSSGYTKGNGELVEAVREALAVLSEPITYADKVALRSSLQAALDHSTSEGVGQTNGDHHDEG